MSGKSIKGVRVGPPPVFRGQALGDDCGRYVVRDHGWLEWRMASLGTAELCNIWVDEDRRGKGIGRSMIEEVASDPLVRVMYGFVAEHHTKMQDLLLTLKFERTLVPNYYGKGRHAVVMVRNVRD